MTVFARWWKCKINEQHNWTDGIDGKRKCQRCGKRQWLYLRRFPEIGEPAAYWDDAP